MKYDYPLVVVTWLDACMHNDGDTVARHEPMRQLTAGWLLRRDRKGVSIAFEYNDSDGTWRDEQFIPAGMIQSLRYIKK